MSVPKAVADQEKRADELIQERLNTEEPAQPEPDPEPAPEPEPEPEPEKGPDYHQAYLVLKGKYDAEVPRLAEQVRERNARIEELETQLAAQPQQPPQPEASDLNADDYAQYGDEFKQLAESHNRLLQENKQYRDEIAQIKESLGSVQQNQQQTTQSTFYSRLGELCPSYETLNHDQKFVEWLQNPNPYTGDLRINTLRDAESKGDANTAAAIFNEWLEFNPQTPEPRTQTPPQPKNVQPSKTSGSETGKDTAPQKRQWTRAQIKAAYQDKARGAYKGRDDEWNAIEKDIFAAQHEDRVVD